MLLSSIVELITPESAAELLSRLAPNQRKLTKSRVRSYAEQMKQGKWRLSSQGIAIDWHGNLQDGQTRLHAVVLSGCSVQMLVIRGVDPDVYLVLDQGKGRTSADIFGIRSTVSEVVRLAAKIAECKGGVLSQDDVLTWLPVVRPLAEEVVDSSGTTAKVLSSATVKLAAVIRMLEGENKDYVLRLYANLVNYNLDALPPVAIAFVKQIAKGYVISNASNNQSSVLGKAMIVFAEDNSDIGKLGIKNPVRYLERAREALLRAKQEMIHE